MRWVDKKIKQYQQGQKATWLEKRALEHAHPVHAALALVSLPLLVYGLWINSWTWIGVGLVLNCVGHLIAQR